MATPWDAIYKQIFVQFLNALGVPVQTQVEVGRLPRTLDAVVVADESQRARIVQWFPFDYFRHYNLLEFKSPTDPLTPDEYKRVIARAYLFLAEVGENDLEKVTVTVITATKPRKVLKGVPQLVRFVEEASGRYRSDDKLSVRVLVAPELPLERRNYLLLLFARGQKLRETLLRLAQEGWWEVVRLAYLLHPKEASEVLAMSRRYPTLEENIRFIVRDLGAERLLREIGAMMEEDPELARRLSRDLLAMSEKVEKLLREDEEQKRKRTNRRRRSRKQGR
ncbi:hypothetical protein Q2T83_16965 [Fervidibacter sacchari]|uniref:Uncharacterized protein n=1 Tax=Candidatus Fervidibacter sacchari TaxID=1448929 RepID=A0ABT2EMR3_9BACT|nr:hypothetical protein [Candidatus Fervidibacter sacchari]MCS3918205.1 hypothetical protein [Candidatus Fervidibacter sacchari]WKU16009.1 hypothetical protein Q2T83_16965 [Candidatus Fervidibacter sacchari]